MSDWRAKLRPISNDNGSDSWRTKLRPLEPVHRDAPIEEPIPEELPAAPKRSTTRFLAQEALKGATEAPDIPQNLLSLASHINPLHLSREYIQKPIAKKLNIEMPEASILERTVDFKPEHLPSHFIQDQLKKMGVDVNEHQAEGLWESIAGKGARWAGTAAGATGLGALLGAGAPAAAATGATTVGAGIAGGLAKIARPLLKSAAPAGEAALLGAGAEAAHQAGLPEPIADIAASFIPSAAKKLAKLPKEALLASVAKGAKPNVEIFKMAKEHGIELPFNVGMNSKRANNAANNVLQSVYTSEAYNEAIKRSNKSVLGAVERSIKSLGAEHTTPEIGSQALKAEAHTGRNIARAEASKLYEEANSLLTDKDKIVPHNTHALIEKIKDKILTTRSNDAGRVKLANTLKDLAIDLELPLSEKYKGTELSGMNKSVVSVLEQENFIKQVTEQLEKKFKTAIPTSKLTALEDILGSKTGYESKNGVENFINGLRGALAADIERSPNKEFVVAHKDADRFYKQNIIDRYRSSVADAILKNKEPKEAYALMTTPKNIELLEKAAGKTPEGIKIFNDLKETKLREVLARNGYNPEREGLSSQSFANLFTKKEHGDGRLVQSLLGKEEYKKLSEVGKIAEQFAKDGRELLNTSGSALVAADLVRKGLVSKAMMMSASTAVSAVLGTTGNLTGAGAAILPAAYAAGYPYILSHMVSSPRIVNFARSYAVARQAGKEALAQNILKRLMQAVVLDSGKIAQNLNNKEQKEE
jgi:hypothetical protein